MRKTPVVERSRCAPAGDTRRVPRRGAPWSLLLVMAWAIGAAGESARAEFPLIRGDDALRATSSAEAQRSAAEAIPIQLLAPEDRERVAGVLSNVTLYRRMPVQVVDCDPDLYYFLVRHPDVVVNIWEVLGITQLTVRQLEPNLFSMEDQAGTTGTFRYLYSSAETQLVYAEGCYKAPLMLKPVQGKTLLLLTSGYVQETSGRYSITNRLDTFVQIEPGGVEILTKTLQPFLTRIADANFVQTLAFVGSLSRTAELNTAGVQRLAGKLEGVDPQHRATLAQLAETIAIRHALSPAEIATLPSDASSR